MVIGPGKVVRLRYKLANDAGELIEDASSGDPVALLIGHRNVIPGLERALVGRTEGERFDVVVEPEEGYGPRRDGQIRRVSKKYVADPKRLRPGRETVVTMDGESRRVTVVKVGGKVVDVDMNHPLAGRRLHFSLEIVEVREATPAELAHGHAHADGKDHH